MHFLKNVQKGCLTEAINHRVPPNDLELTILLSQKRPVVVSYPLMTVI